MTLDKVSDKDLKDNKRRPRCRRWRWFHKWVGLVMSVFLLVFCVSGILLNHREGIRSLSISRSLLPPSYRLGLENYNNGIVKGTLPLGGDSLLVFGNSGIWLTDRDFSRFSDFNAGLPEGADNRNIRNVVRTRGGQLFCASQFGLYSLTRGGWREIPLQGLTERLSDVTLTPDSLRPVVLTRSGVYLPERAGFRFQELRAPVGYERRSTLFKVFWELHSGALFGTVGRVCVDVVALILVFLCLTGIVVFAMPYSLRRVAADKVKRRARTLKWNFREHNRVGLYTIVLTLVIAVTGMCLRPPLMIPLVLTETAPVPGTTMGSPNPWHDKLRAIRYDADANEWLVSTSEGFLCFKGTLDAVPQLLPVSETPAVSPMGVTVFEKDAQGEWLIGSFSGLYRWDRKAGSMTDYFTGKAAVKPTGRPIAEHAVAGYSADLRSPVVFDYGKGADTLPAMPQELREQKMSLWNFALELHVGRCYDPLLGPLSSMFIFISGLLITLVLVSGLILNRRAAKKKRK